MNKTLIVTIIVVVSLGTLMYFDYTRTEIEPLPEFTHFTTEEIENSEEGEVSDITTENIIEAEV